MKTIRIIFFFPLCCLPVLSVVAASPTNWVIRWGWNTAAGKPIPPSLVASNALAVSAGTFHGLSLNSDGTVTSLGANSVKQTTASQSEGESALARIKGEILTNVVSIVAAREHSLALKADGSVITWGENYIPRGLTNIVAIGASTAHSWVLTRQGTVTGWFREPVQTFDLLPVHDLSNVVAIAVGSGPQENPRGLALKNDGTVAHWGAKTPSPTPPPGLSNVIAIAAGSGHSLALKSDGTVVGWGWNKGGEATGIPTTNAINLDYFASGQVRIGGQILSNVTSIAAGRGYSMALKKDGTLVAWGRMVNELYPAMIPEELSNVTAIAAGEENFCLAITTNAAVASKLKPQ